ncbi:MAG: hypothetical protein AAFN74_27280 [Myxococcota bacterium]
MNGGHTSPPFQVDAIVEQQHIVSSIFEAMMTSVYGGGNWLGMAERAFADGRVLAGFGQFLRAHGVTKATADQLIHNSCAYEPSVKRVSVPAQHRGRLASINTRRLGVIARDVSREGSCSTGVVLRKRLGDLVKAGEPIAEVWSRSTMEADRGAMRLVDAFELSNGRPEGYRAHFVAREAVHIRAPSRRRAQVENQVAAGVGLR